MNRCVTAISTGLAAVSILVGCGPSDSSSGSSSDDTQVSPVESTDGESAGFNDADVMFAQMMIPHHEQAIEMSDIALDPQVGASEVVRELATRIKAAQDPEIDQMATLLTTWGRPTAMDTDVDHSSMMSGMLTLDELANLSQMRGVDFDRAWLEAMIAHHEGAVDMAQDVIEDGLAAEVRALAEQIIAGQQGEIDEMLLLLG